MLDGGLRMVDVGPLTSAIRNPPSEIPLVFRHRSNRRGLRNKICCFARYTVVERPPVYLRQLFSKITMARRAWCCPFERVRMPRISFGHTPACKDAHEEIDEEHQLGCAENESRNGDE